jgi:hypothetical protein
MPRPECVLRNWFNYRRSNEDDMIAVTPAAGPGKLKSASQTKPRPGREGRKKETWPPIEVPIGYVIAKVSDWMVEHRESRRPLSVAAPLLATVCWLHSKNYNFPTRGRIAKALRTTVDSVDSAISTAIGHGELTEVHKTEPGEVKGRESIVRRRYLVPSRQLQMVYADAIREASHGRRVAG